MKLSNPQINCIRDALDIEPVDSNQNLQVQLEEILGEHTFFVGDKGLFVFEEEQQVDGGNKLARMFLVAAWSNDDKQELAPVAPRTQVDVIFDLVDGTIVGGK